MFQDSITSGQWHYCFDCHSSGDLIELAARAWDLSPQGAIRKLARLGFNIPEEQLTDAELTRYVKDHPQRRRRWAAFWVEAQKRLVDRPTADLSKLRSKFKLNSPINRDRWLSGPGKLIGAASTKLIRELTGQTSGGYQWPFKGRNWGDLLTIPYYSAPERLVGYLCIGREGSRGDRVMISVRGMVGSHIEAGLAGLHTVAESKTTFGQYAFAFDDPILAIRLQVRHAASSLTPLPLVSWYDALPYRTETSWESLLNRCIVFWAWKLTPQIVMQAASCDGHISVMPIEDVKQRTIDHYVRSGTPRDLLNKALKRSRPWRDAVIEWAKKQSPGAVEELMLGLDARGMDTQPLMVQIAEAVENAVLLPERRSIAWTKGSRIVDRENGWYHVTKQGKWILIAEARMRIDKIIGNTYYGHVLFKGQEIPFKHSADAMRYPYDVMRRACIHAGLGYPKSRVMAKSYNLVEIAVRFQEPVVECETPQPPQTRVSGAAKPSNA